MKNSILYHGSAVNPTRRGFLRQFTLGAALFTTPGLFAEELTRSAKLVETPRLTEGPYYPDKLPLDTDNDLLIINNSITPAVGDISYVSGRVLSASGEPLRNMFVEVWQCDSKASYIHTRGHNPGGVDGNFQGYGRFMTDSSGNYFFRTIKPVPYTLNGMFRAPHIHVAVSRNGSRVLTTQLLIRGHEANTRDNILEGVRDARARESVLVEFKPLAGSRIGELQAHFDIVLGQTAHEGEDGALRGGIGKSDGRGGPGGPGGMRPPRGGFGPPPDGAPGV